MSCLKPNNQNYQSELSTLLKRKRLEMGLKLDELSSGVCSVSYLSRIENSLVDVSPTYFKALFEKMNLDYEDVKTERSRNLYIEILQAYFRFDFALIEEIVLHALECKKYAEVEINLMLLFYNIAIKRFDEARDLIAKLDILYEGFFDIEKQFYLYSVCFYTYSTNNCKNAYKQIIALLKMKKDDFFSVAILDLGIKIMLLSGKNTFALKLFFEFEKLARMPVFNICMSLHKLAMLAIDSNHSFEETKNEFENNAKYLNMDLLNVKECYYYNLALILFTNEKYEEAYHFLFNNLISARICAVFTSCLFYIKNYDFLNAGFMALEKYRFSKHEKMYYDFYRYAKMLYDGESDYVLFNYLRNILVISSSFFDSFLNSQIEIQFLDRAIGCSKYKDGLKIIYRNMRKNDFF